jgi:hypothetical protein
MKNKTLYISLLVIISLLIAAVPVQAICPVCTVAVLGGVGLSRYLGVDDLITGLWVGAVTVSMIMWTIEYLNRKKIKFFGRKILILVLYYAMIIWPLFHYNFVGHTLGKIMGVDKLLVGMGLGSIFFYAGAYYYEQLKADNNGKAHFPFEKVVVPLGPLIILSIAFYFLTK